MKCLHAFVCLMLLPHCLGAADRGLKVDPARSFVDVDVKSTTDSFTAHLDAYALHAQVDEKGRIRKASLTFRFADLKTGKPDRDAKMLMWLGGDDPTGKFDLGILALTPSGQGQVTGNLSFHDTTALVEFPVNITSTDNTYVITGEATIDYTRWNLKVIRIMMLLKVDRMVRISFKFTGETIEPPAGN